MVQSRPARLRVHGVVLAAGGFILNRKLTEQYLPKYRRAMKLGTSGDMGEISPVLGGEQIIEIQNLVKRVPISDQVLGYAWALVRASRPDTDEAPDFVNKWVSWGAGPRGVLTLITCAKARALLYGRYHATVADVKAVAKPALRHRLACNYHAQASGINSEKLIDMLLEAVPDDKQYEKPAA